MTDQDAMHRGGGPADPGGDPGRAELVGAAQPTDLGLHGRGHPAGVMVGDAGPVVKAGLATLAVAGPPAVGAGAGDAHLGRDMGDGAASGDALAQDQPSRRRQPGVNVGHEDLRWVSRQTAPPRRRSSPPVSNPHAQYRLAGQMMANEPSRAGDQNSWSLLHSAPPCVDMLSEALMAFLFRPASRSTSVRSLAADNRAEGLQHDVHVKGE